MDSQPRLENLALLGSVLNLAWFDLSFILKNISFYLIKFDQFNWLTSNPLDLIDYV